MTITVPSDCRLWATIRENRFYELTERELLKQMYCCFKDEINRLKRAYAVEGDGSSTDHREDGRQWTTPSQVLFGEDYDEINRTLTGVLALRWIMTDDYERFISGQNEATKLSPASFQWLKQYYTDHLSDPEDLFCLILAVVVNDLGKDPILSEDYFDKTNKIIFQANHDTILLEAAKADMVPCLSYLDDTHRQDIMLGLELGSELNAAQLAQAENVPVNLEGLLRMHGNEHAFNLKFMEQILDLAGAQAHVHTPTQGHFNGATNLTEPVFQAFKTVQEASLSIIKRQCTLRQGYDRVLSGRGAMLEAVGYKHLSVHDDKQRALLRLLTMGRTSTLQQATLIERAFTDLDPVYKSLLIQGLNIDGDREDQTAVIPYYMPAMLAEAIRNTRNSPKQVQALTSLMRYLARVLVWGDTEDEQEQQPTNHKTWPIDEAARRTSTAADRSLIAPVNLHHRTMRTTQPESQTQPQVQIPTSSESKSDSGSNWNKVQEHVKSRKGRVFERNMTKAREMINSLAFRESPEIMDGLDPPEGHLVPRRWTANIDVDVNGIETGRGIQ